MPIRLATVLALSSVAASSSFAHDSDRIDQLEREVQETKKRLSILESMLQNKNDENDLVVTNEGWKPIANWRKLTTGMSTSTVRKIPGDAKRINGGTFATWHYENRGFVLFYEGKVDRWSEPN